MADNVSTVVDNNDAISMRSQLTAGVDSTSSSDEGSYENRKPDTFIKEEEGQQKEQELPELIRRKDESKALPCLPYINLSELTTILRDPKMPSQKILQEVADKIMLKSEESESDDGSVSSGGGFVGMKGLLDCIFEVSYNHEDSASSDDDDESFQKFSREIPCKFCDKIFGSTMTWSTHVLVAHTQQESSVLNIHRLSSNEHDKNHPQKKYARCTSKSESDAKVHHAPVTDNAHNENAPARKRRSSFSKTQLKEDIPGKIAHKHHPSVAGQKKKEPSPAKEKVPPTAQKSTPVKSVETAKEVSKTEIFENVCAGPKLVGVEHDSDVPAEKICRESSVDESQNINEMCSDHSSHYTQDNIDKHQNTDTNVNTLDSAADASNNNSNLKKNIRCGKKRKSTSPHHEPETSVHTSSNPKCSKKSTNKNSVSHSEQKGV